MAYFLNPGMFSNMLRRYKTLDEFQKKVSQFFCHYTHQFYLSLLSLQQLVFFIINTGSSFICHSCHQFFFTTFVTTATSFICHKYCVYFYLSLLPLKQLVFFIINTGSSFICHSCHQFYLSQILSLVLFVTCEHVSRECSSIVPSFIAAHKLLMQCAPLTGTHNLKNYTQVCTQASNATAPMHCTALKNAHNTSC